MKDSVYEELTSKVVTQETGLKIRNTLEILYREVDNNGVITDCNDYYLERLGRVRQDVIGTSSFEHSPQSDHLKITKATSKWKDTDETRHVKIQLITQTGDLVNVLMTLESRRDADGNITGFGTRLRDMSEIKTLQNLVKLKKYESLYDNSPDMYRTVNIDGIIIDCNRSYLEKLGYTKDEVIGIDLVEHTAPRSKDAITSNMKKWAKDGLIRSSVIWMLKKDGTEFPSHLTPTNLYDDSNVLIGRNVVIKDTSDLHKTKKDLDELTAIERQKEEFLSVVTHELKSPLTPIVGFSQALLKPGMIGDLNEKQTNAMNTILANAKRLRTLIGDLLDVHKLELGKMHFEMKEFSLDDLLKSIGLSFNYVAKEKMITINTSIDQEIKMVSDRQRIEQVITNLTYNAVDFIPKDTGRIDITISQSDSDIYFEVKDNGVGIAPEKQKQLFSKFYQADTSATRKHGGTGLGLSICKGIVESLGGTIGLESQVGVGSKFYFVLPCTQN